MPRGDGTGPEGLGPATGRGLGYCTGHSTPGFTKAGGRGLARGRGRGIGRGLARGFRGGRGRGLRRAPPIAPVERPFPVRRAPRTTEGQRAYYGEYTEEDEIEDLKAYADQLEEELELVEERLDELTE
ncbi:MAG: DUF5320 domain-containing protein [Candidatus Thermoplasmatota archaeon]|nr:DUF5320 domain-containing protein [Candidatus Thermoplasmatota archaeon]